MAPPPAEPRSVGIGHVIRSAAMQGIKVHAIQVPQASSNAPADGVPAQEAKPGKASPAAATDGRPEPGTVRRAA